MDDVLISVIMSVYNGESYLSRGVESIINQTFKRWELLICDDGSTDGTWDILSKYSSMDPRIRIYKNEENRGLAYSLNRLINLAQSNILARQDADDSSELNRFEVQYPFVITHPEYAIVGTSWNNVDENGAVWVTHPITNPSAKQLIWDGGFMHPSWMMRRDMLEKVGFYTVSEYTRRDQDYHLVLKLYGAGMKMLNMQEVLYNYTNDSGTFSRTKNWKRVKGLMWVRWDGYKRNHFPLWAYLIVLKPLVKNLLPTFITKRYYLRERKNENSHTNQ